MDSSDGTNSVRSITRIRVMYGVLLLVFAVFTVRLFYLQIIRHDTYVKAAQSDQIHEYEIDANRGTIYAQMGDSTVPLVVNQKLFTVYADPTMVKQPDQVATTLAPLLGAKASDLKTLLTLKNLRYVVLAKRITPDVSQKILAYKMPGIGSQEQNYRAYPQGDLASQLLGFVNDAGQGKYGIEQALNTQLGGKNGLLKAVTDVNGVPLAASGNNVLVPPKPGENITLTIDLGMQAQVEQILKRYQEQFGSEKISAIVMETNTGAVKAMANYPTYDPSNYGNVQDESVFQNSTVSDPIEPGSITKVLSTAAALDVGSITPDSAYYDPGVWNIDGAKIVNVSEGMDRGPQDIRSMLNLSLNTGAVWVLMQDGGGQINDKARQILYNYYTKHYRLGQATGIEQGYEAPGYVPGPANNGNGIDLTYANMSFGQAYTATSLQMIAAASAVFNGGTYYQPHLVAAIDDGSGMKPVAPKVLEKNVVSAKTSQEMVDLLNYVVKRHAESWAYMNFGNQYVVGGKTGTAQLINNAGTAYRSDVFNGSYLGFVGGDKPQYTIIIYNYKPKHYGGYAGAEASQPIFADIAHMLINNYGVTPKSK